jgi:hypothetical protein
MSKFPYTEVITLLYFVNLHELNATVMYKPMRREWRRVTSLAPFDLRMYKLMLSVSCFLRVLQKWPRHPFKVADP